MQNRTPKVGDCDECDGKGVDLYRTNSPKRCKSCFFKEKKRRLIEGKKSTSQRRVLRPRKNIAPASEKKLKELAKYRPIRDKYLSENTECEVDDCSSSSTHVHHKAGRAGSLLYNPKYFMAVCNDCHPSRIHHEANDGWARKKGYIINVDNKK